LVVGGLDVTHAVTRLPGASLDEHSKAS
jgi:hypothetical protein